MKLHTTHVASMTRLQRLLRGVEVARAGVVSLMRTKQTPRTRAKKSSAKKLGSQILNFLRKSESLARDLHPRLGRCPPAGLPHPLSPTPSSEIAWAVPRPGPSSKAFESARRGPRGQQTPSPKRAMFSFKIVIKTIVLVLWWRIIH